MHDVGGDSGTGMPVRLQVRRTRWNRLLVSEQVVVMKTDILLPHTVRACLTFLLQLCLAYVHTLPHFFSVIHFSMLLPSPLL